MNKRNELIAYALDFASYLIANLEGIERIILFGSVARGDFDKESDVDLFIDTKSRKTRRIIPKLEQSFYGTQKSKNWQLKGIKNRFSVLVGELDGKEWQDLKRGMANNALVMYGKYQIIGKKTQGYILFSFEKVKPDKKRVALYRALYGFNLAGKEYSGLVQKYNIIRLGTGCILAPINSALMVKSFFREKKVPIKVYEIWSDYDLK